MWGQYCDIESIQNYDNNSPFLSANDKFDLVDNIYNGIGLNIEDNWDSRVMEMLNYTTSRLMISIIFGTLIMRI